MDHVSLVVTDHGLESAFDVYLVLAIVVLLY